MDSECVPGTCDAEVVRRPACGLVSNITDSHMSLCLLEFGEVEFPLDLTISYIRLKDEDTRNLGERYCKEVLFKWWGGARHHTKSWCLS